VSTVIILIRVTRFFMRNSSGSRHVVHLHSQTSHLSSLANLKLCLYHPANASLASGLVSVLDEVCYICCSLKHCFTVAQRLREACQDCVEEWLIAIVRFIYNFLVIYLICVRFGRFNTVRREALMRPTFSESISNI